MGLFDTFTGGFMDEIRCDESSYLIWKWHPKNSKLGDNRRENAIRLGSSLRVKDGEVAVFVYNQPNGVKQDFIVGPCDQTIQTNNLPVLASIIGLVYDGGTPFQAEVYFINLAQIIQTKFAVPYFDIYDPRFPDFGVPVAVRGTISFKITDYEQFIKLHRLNSFYLQDFQVQIRDAVSRYVKNIVINAPTTYNIPLIQIESKIDQMNVEVASVMKERLGNDFGVEMRELDIGVIEFNKDTEAYANLMSVTKELVMATKKAEAEANIKNIADKQRIDIEDYEGRLRIQREEGQYAQHKQTQSANMGAFQVETQAQVGIAGAEALGKMGSGGAGDVDLGSGGAGFNPAAMMASMAVGGAVGQNIADAMKNVMPRSEQMTSPVTPPPIPVSKYHIAVNGSAVGPYDISTLTNMALNGQLLASTLVWKPGMSEWAQASAMDDLKNLFMPPIPKME